MMLCQFVAAQMSVSGWSLVGPESQLLSGDHQISACSNSRLSVGLQCL